MTEYYNKRDLFMEPKTQQYGNHMIMTNVHKPSKSKHISIDTKFRDDYDYTHPANYQIDLPERINDVHSMRVTNIEIPMSFYNISSNLGNNSLKIIKGGLETIITLDDNYYDTISLSAEIATKIATITDLSGLSITIEANYRTTITTTYDVSMQFDVDNLGNSDKFKFKQKIGWMLGFRRTTYNILANVPITAECMPDLSGPRYLYLAIDEFSRGNQNTFVTPVFSSSINKNIIARISLDMKRFGYGNILPANNKIGLLATDTRSYTGKIDLQKLQVQLLDDYGAPIYLNGNDFSFCLEVMCE